MVLPFIIFIHQ